MKFYIVDDDISVIKMVEEIVKDTNYGEIVGVNVNSKMALEEVSVLKPDILLLDLLMPDMDGITFVEKIKKTSPMTKAIMISQVSSKKIIGDAYESGITFFVTKPINRKEIRQVVQNVANQISLEKSMHKIRQVLSLDGSQRNYPITESDETLEKRFKMVFSRLGILGESGCDEIIKFCSYMSDKDDSVHQMRLMDISKEISDNPKAMEQRIRRAINRGLSNIAHLGVEDYLNETFVKFSNTLFDFEQVRTEMEYIRGNSLNGGKINIKKFLDNLMVIVDQM